MKSNWLAKMDVTLKLFAFSFSACAFNPFGNRDEHEYLSLFKNIDEALPTECLIKRSLSASERMLFKDYCCQKY